MGWLMDEVSGDWLSEFVSVQVSGALAEQDDDGDGPSDSFRLAVIDLIGFDDLTERGQGSLEFLLRVGLVDVIEALEELAAPENRVAAELMAHVGGEMIKRLCTVVGKGELQKIRGNRVNKEKGAKKAEEWAPFEKLYKELRASGKTRKEAKRDMWDAYEEATGEEVSERTIARHAKD
jgi:hypothetical protein